MAFEYVDVNTAQQRHMSRAYAVTKMQVQLAKELVAKEFDGESHAAQLALIGSVVTALATNFEAHVIGAKSVK